MYIPCFAIFILQYILMTFLHAATNKILKTATKSLQLQHWKKLLLSLNISLYQPWRFGPHNIASMYTCRGRGRPPASLQPPSSLEKSSSSVLERWLSGEDPPVTTNIWGRCTGNVLSDLSLPWSPPPCSYHRHGHTSLISG